MWGFMIVPTVTVSDCLFHGVWGFCVSVRVPLQLFLSYRLWSGACRSSLMGTLNYPCGQGLFFKISIMFTIFYLYLKLK